MTATHTTPKSTRSTTVHRSLLATAAGILLLAACGSTGTSSKVDGTTTQPATTVVEAAVAPETTTAAPDTTVASTASTAAPAAASAPVTVDASVNQALKDADALLGANDQDMASASSAAANGG